MGWKVPFGGSGALGGRAHWAGNYPSVGQAPSVAKPIIGLKVPLVGQAPSAAKPIGLQSTPRWVRCPRWQSPLGWKVGDRFTAFKALCAPALRSAAAQENTASLVGLDSSRVPASTSSVCVSIGLHSWLRMWPEGMPVRHVLGPLSGPRRRDDGGGNDGDAGSGCGRKECQFGMCWDPSVGQAPPRT